MSVAIAAIGAIAVAVVILFTVVFAFFELTPFAHHAEQFRDIHGKKMGSSPRLD